MLSVRTKSRFDAGLLLITICLVKQESHPTDSSLGLLLVAIGPPVFGSLTHLSAVVYHVALSSSDPLLGLCADDVLPNLTSLELLELEIHFAVMAYQTSLLAEFAEHYHEKPCWEELDSVVSQLTFAKLRAVNLHVYLEQGLDTCLSRWREIHSWTCKEMFTGLRRKADEGFFTFEFFIKTDSPF